MNGDLVMVLVVVAALAFAFSNGFHDTFDVISTAVSVESMARSSTAKMSFQRITTIGSVPPANSEATAWCARRWRRSSTTGSTRWS